jgi:tetratricopeptide (TPR) repeat protein
MLPCLLLLGSILIHTGGLVTDGYVDDARCAKCHRDISHGYETLGMARSLAVPRPDSAIADCSTTGGYFAHEASGQHYRMWFDDEGRMWMRQYELDSEGREINALSIEAHFGVGSGNHARTYLHRSPSGELWELPVTWYAHGGWNMSPGYDRAEHDRFSRRVGRDCLFCHNAYPDTPEGEDRPGRPETFPEVLPEGIGCQRCHGPGKRHVDLAYSANATDEAIAQAILNPADLGPVAQDEICLQCHLQPTSRLGALVRPTDRGDYSYRPGEPLDAYIAHVAYDVDGQDETFEVNHHAYQLRKSACWQGEGSLTCLSCHDPHHKPSPVDRIERYRAACLTCHALNDCHVERRTGAPLGPDPDCASCHMPLTRPSDAIHTIVTDHRIQLPPADAAQLLAPLSELPPPSQFTPVLHRGKAANAPRLEALGRVISGDNTVALELAAAMEPDAPRRQQLMAAEALLESGHEQAAADRLRSLLQDSPWIVPGQVNLALIEAKGGDIDAAMARMEQVVRDTPLAADAWAQLGPLYWAKSRTTDAIEAAAEAARLRPLGAEHWSRLGTYLASAKAFEQASAAFARSEALMPGNPTTAYNLGLSQWKLDQPADAARTWQHALGRSPTDAKLLKMAAMTTLLPFPGIQTNVPRGIERARSWIAADATDADGLALLAYALHRNSNAQEAATMLQQAADAGADRAAVSLVHAFLLEAAGQTQTARAKWLRVSRAIDRPDRLTLFRRGLLHHGRTIFEHLSPR